MNHDMTFTLKYAFMNKEEVRPGSIYQGAYQGVGLARHEFNQWLANPISVYLFQGAPIVNLSRSCLLYTSVAFDTWYQSLKTTRFLLAGRNDIDVYYWIDGLGVEWIPFIRVSSSMFQY